MIDPINEEMHRVMSAILELAMRRIFAAFGISPILVVYNGRDVIFASNLDPQFDPNELRQLQHPGRILDTAGIERIGYEVHEYKPKSN